MRRWFLYSIKKWSRPTVSTQHNNNEQLPFGESWLSLHFWEQMFVCSDEPPSSISSDLLPLTSSFLFPDTFHTWTSCTFATPICKDRVIGEQWDFCYLPWPHFFLKKLFPSNLCSARNETEPRFCRNLRMSSLEDSPLLSLLGTSTGDLPSRWGPSAPIF